MIPVLNIIHLPKWLFPSNNNLHLESIRREQNIKAQAYEHKFTYGIWDGIVTKIPWTGISQSHKRIVQHGKDNRLNLTFIAEDDIKILPGGWRYFTENIPDDFDIYLAGISGGKIDEQTKEVTNWTGLFLYCVHHRFYEAFLAANEMENIDCWLSKKGLLEIEKILGRKPVYKICYPMAAITRDGVSYKSGEYVQHDKFFKGYQLHQI